MQLSFIHGDTIASFDGNSGDGCLDFVSDLSKALFGFRGAFEVASEIYADFKRENPSQVPVVWNGSLLTASQVQAEIDAEIDAEIAEAQAAAQARREARIAAKREWQEASPMAQAVRDSGLLALRKSLASS